MIRPYVPGHWFGCSLLLGTPLNSLCQEVGFIRPFVVIDPTNSGATTVVVVAPGLYHDNFLPIPDAESLPFYPSVLKLVVCVSSHCDESRQSPPAAAALTVPRPVTVTGKPDCSLQTPSQTTVTQAGTVAAPCRRGGPALRPPLPGPELPVL